ncbi:AraC family transcriptional regulator [Paenibacillus timonensis]|uniref:Helix-turn-helix domain-containing protein n=1 Tax=Paenibacillus timonensis TaxID=225915 RepID=A0ABW3SH78_9BACL|nr:AraC family transcriptional regulator [Paenibacillus timonensis]MCH1642861.1 AraC family transcriptional regulator [Paenibacillus timonensis]
MKAISPQKAAVQAMIERIEAEYHRVLTLEELASHVSYSKFHAERLFQRRTGLSISQYLSLVRIEKSKNLLIDSRYTVCEISARVGYASVSTFSRTFKEYVGVQPNLFRKTYRDRQIGIVEMASSRLGLCEKPPPDNDGLSGTVTADRPVKGLILIGLFSEPVPKGAPASCTLLRETGTFTLSDVDDGQYYAFALALEFPLVSVQYFSNTHGLRGRSHLPVLVQRGAAPEPIRIHLRPPLVTDPPIAVSPFYLLQNFWSKRWQMSNPG